MGDTDMLSTVAGLLGEPARTRILTALLTGRALTAKELAYFAGVTAATASSHLSRLVAGHLLVMEKQGRCHYYRLRSAEVARAIEGLMTVATEPARDWPPQHRVEPALREARMCYDHIAGRLGVALCDMLLRRRHVVLADGGGEVTPGGARFLTGLGVDLPKARGPAPVLPRVPRLDRAAPSHLGRGGRGARRGLPRAALDRARARQPGARGDPRRAQEARRSRSPTTRSRPSPVRSRRSMKMSALTAT